MNDAPDRGFVVRVLVKALLLFAAANLAWALLVPAGANAVLGRVSLYNRIFPGRARFPFGENPQESYNLSLYNLDAMFASHEVSKGKAVDEYRVVLIGDSSVWGTLLKPEETLAGQINAQNLVCAGKTVRAYNLGYPTISLTKDVIILRRALGYAPDMLVWPTTLEAFPREKQLASPLAANNAGEIPSLPPSPKGGGGKQDGRTRGSAPTIDNTIIGQRRALADLLRLQAYGVMWAATGIDQAMPETYTPAAVDLEAEEGYYGLENPHPGPALRAFGVPEGDPHPGPALRAFGVPEGEGGLAFDVLTAGMEMAEAAGVPVILVNEPMLISAGENSDVRYNFFYPRWIYDAWREEMHRRAAEQGWPLLDAWDLLPVSAFTNSAIHLTPAGETTFARQVGAEIARLCK